MGTMTSRKRGKLLALCCALCLAALMGLAACGSSGSASGSSAASATATGSTSQASASASAAAGDTVSYTDSAGRTVDLPATIDRVAITGPISQMAMLTLAPEKLVGLSNELSENEMKYVGAYSSLDVLGQIYGGKGDFNKEAVANANPQVIIDIGEAKKSIVEDLDAIQAAIGIPCVHIEATIDTYDKAYTELGELLGVQDRATELAAYCADAYAKTTAAIEAVPADQRVKVAYLLGDAGLNAMAKGSFQGTVVDMIADNLAEFEQAGGSGLGNETNFEQIALWDPAMIIFAPDSIYDTVADDPTWQTLTAVQQGNYYAVPGEPYNWISSPPGINQILGMQWFAHLCYPDQFDDSIADVAKGYYKTFYGYELTDEACDELIANSVPKN